LEREKAPNYLIVAYFLIETEQKFCELKGDKVVEGNLPDLHDHLFLDGYFLLLPMEWDGCNARLFV